VYDADGSWIGLIDGQAVTGASAKFSVYDRNGDRVGIAYLDKTNDGFTIVDPEYENKYIASFRRNFIQNTTDYWKVNVYDTNAIDLRVLKIFGAFAADTQDDFKKDK